MYKNLEKLSGHVGKNKRNGNWYVWTNEGAYVLNLCNLKTLHDMFPQGWNNQKIVFYLKDNNLIINTELTIEWL